MLIRAQINSSQPSKNPSLHKLNFPSLSHKPSESLPERRLLDLGLAPHWNDNLTVTDCSSAGRFFRQSDSSKTPRAISHSFRMPKAPNSRETYVSKHLDSSKSLDLSCVWEITERVDTFKLRSDSHSSYPKTCDTVFSQLALWNKCSCEVTSILKSVNPDLSCSLSTIYSHIFSLFTDLSELKENTEASYKENIGELNVKVNLLQKEVMVASQQYTDLLASFKFDEKAIKKEVDEMFPSYEEEIKRLKEESMNLRNRRFGVLPEALEKIYNDLSKDQPIPEATEMDITAINADDFVNGMRDKYRVIISTTVKRVKQNVIKKVLKINEETQTSGVYVEMKVYDDLVKQLEKANVTYQSAMMQLENHKEVSSSKGHRIEKTENEKNAIRSENLQLKRDIELLNKELASLKFELESRKNEILMITKQSNEKTELNVDLETRIESLTEKILDLSYELERSRRSRPPSEGGVSRKPSAKMAEEEPKKNRLDEVLKSGLTVREELEKLYSGGLSMRSSKPSEANLLRNSDADKHLPSSKVVAADNGALSNKPQTSSGSPQNTLRKLDLPPGQSLEEKVVLKIPEFIESNEGSADEVSPDQSEHGSRKSSRKKSTKAVKREKVKPTESKEAHKNKPTKVSESKKVAQASPRNESPKIQQTKPQPPRFKPVERNERKRTVALVSASNSSQKPEKQTVLTKVPIEVLEKDQVYSDCASPKISMSRYDTEEKADYSQYPSLSFANAPESNISIPPLSLYKILPATSEIHSISIPGQVPHDVSAASISSGDSDNSQSLPTCDKSCGNDFKLDASIGVQVDMSKPFDEPEPSRSQYFLPYNPNNIFGLRGDVYYQGQTFQPQPRIPDLATSMMFTPSYKYS